MSSFVWKSFLKKWYSSWCYNRCFAHVETEPKWIYYFEYTNAANENCVKFCIRKFWSVGREEWCNEMKYGQKLKLGDDHVTPRNIQEVQASKLGDARASPSSSTKYQVIFQCAIFLLLHILCAVLGASFVFVFSLFCFVCCNK